MKKMALGLVFIAGIALAVYASCIDSIDTHGSDNASLNSSCYTIVINGTNYTAPGDIGQCNFTLYNPAEQTCGTSGTDNKVCGQLTNTVTITIQKEKGKCDGSGGCGSGQVDGDPTYKTNNVVALSTCGG